MRQVDVIDPQSGDLAEPEPGADRNGDQVADVLVGGAEEGLELRLRQVHVIGSSARIALRVGAVFAHGLMGISPDSTACWNTPYSRPW